MSEFDALDVELTRQVRARLAEKEWTVIGVAAGASLLLMGDGLHKLFNYVDDVTDVVVIVCRKEHDAHESDSQR